MRACIIDLRLCGGGNLWPMLVGVAPFFESGAVARSVGQEADGASGTPSRGPATLVGIDSDEGWFDHGAGRVVQYRWRGGPQFDELPGSGARPSDARGAIDAPIAVLLGPWTMSSGEFVALALAGRARTRSFGEPTADLTTVTDFIAIADGGVFVLPVARMAALKRPPTDSPLAPDERAEFGAWPTADDDCVAAAVRWLEALQPEFTTECAAE